MIKNILVYKWNTDSNPDLAKSLLSMGYAIVEFSEKFDDYHMDAAFVMKVMDCIQAENIQMVLSWNYLPLLASVCEMHKLPYVSWICSYPQRALFSKTLL